MRIDGDSRSDVLWYGLGAIPDAYATAAYAMGPDGPAWTAQLGAAGYEAMTILAEEVVVSTAGFPA